MARARTDAAVRARLDTRAQRYIAARFRRDVIVRNVDAARASTPALTRARRDAAKWQHAERHRAGAAPRARHAPLRRVTSAWGTQSGPRGRNTSRRRGCASITSRSGTQTWPRGAA